jgi:hypothetical protein
VGRVVTMVPSNVSAWISRARARRDRNPSHRPATQSGKCAEVLGLRVRPNRRRLPRAAHLSHLECWFTWKRWPALHEPGLRQTDPSAHGQSEYSRRGPLFRPQPGASALRIPGSRLPEPSRISALGSRIAGSGRSAGIRWVSRGAHVRDSDALIRPMMRVRSSTSRSSRTSPNVRCRNS